MSERPLPSDLDTPSRADTEISRTVARGSGPRTSIAPVSAEQLDEAVRRVGLLAMALSVATGLALVVPYFVSWANFGDPWIRRTVHVPFFICSVALAVAAFRRRIPTSRVLDVALAYQLLASIVLAMIVNSRDWPAQLTLPGWSPVAVLTLIAPVVVPTTMSRAVIAAVLGALLEPVIVIAHAQLGVMQMPTAGAMLFRFLPNIVVVPAAILVARLIHRMGVRLARAQELGSYRLIERIGVGGMGEVWRASHRLLAREAAVKLIRPELLASSDDSGETARARFEREARVIAGLRSPHTIQLYDYGVASDGTLYFVMELLDGVDLESMVRASGPLSPERVVHMTRQVCRSLREAHAAHLVHRDIKPANIFVCGSQGDHVKVLDFGLVRERASDDGVALTRDNVILGTPAYLPPETAVSSQAPDARADLYALGCVMYFALTGALVFEASTAMEMVLAHAMKTPQPPSARTERPIPAALEAIVLRCLEKDPALRPASADELDALLEAVTFDGAGRT